MTYRRRITAPSSIFPCSSVFYVVCLWWLLGFVWRILRGLWVEPVHSHPPSILSSEKTPFRSLTLSLSPRWRLLLSCFRLSLKVKLLWDESKRRSKRVSGTLTSLLEVFPEKTSKHQKSQKRRLGGEKCGGDRRRIQLSWTPERENICRGFLRLKWWCTFGWVWRAGHVLHGCDTRRRNTLVWRDVHIYCASVTHLCSTVNYSLLFRSVQGG